MWSLLSSAQLTTQVICMLGKVNKKSILLFFLLFIPVLLKYLIGPKTNNLNKNPVCSLCVCPILSTILYNKLAVLGFGWVGSLWSTGWLAGWRADLLHR